MNNDLIMGQRALDRLIFDAENGSVSHAYILEGPRGVGKKTAAMEFAAALHCREAKKPCGVCPDCVMHRAGTHPDVFILEPEESGAIKIEAVRAAADELYMKPKLAEKKILIIDGADGMTQSAQNALLKSFEEPPTYGVVLLLSENIQNLLPTIRSRGVKLRLEPFPKEKIREYVERHYPNMREKSGFAAAYSGGIIGRAIELCEDSEFFELRSSVIEAARGLAGGKESIFPLAQALGVGSKKTAGARKDVCFDVLLSWFGDAALYKQGLKVVNVDRLKELEEFCAGITAKNALSALETVEETAAGLNNSMKYDLWVVNMIIKCWRNIHGYSSRS